MNMTKKIFLRRVLMVMGIAVTCGGAVWLAALVKTNRDTVERGAQVLADIRSSRAIFNDSDRLLQVGLLDSEDSEAATETLIPLLDRDSRIEWQHVSAVAIGNGILQKFDVLIVPGGNGRLKSKDLGDSGRTMVRDFVNHGGGYVGICGGAFLATCGYDWSLSLVDAAALTGTIECGQEGQRSLAARGSGVVSIEFSGSAEVIFSRSVSYEPMQYSGGPIFRRQNRSDLSPFVVLGWFRTEVYVCSLQRGTMVNTPAIIASKFGEGKVVLFSPHPEMTPGTESLVTDAVHSVVPAHFGSR